LWGMVSPYTGAAPPMKHLDANADGKVGRDELADYYRREGLGGVTVGVGTAPFTAGLTDALLKQRDTDGDGLVSEKEWKAAPESLRKLDRNDDELVGPGELVAKAAYPGTAGSLLLSAPAEADKPKPETDHLPFVVLPLREADTFWATALVRRRDKDKNGQLDAKEAGLAPGIFAQLDGDKNGQLSAEELAGWRKLEPDVRLRTRLGQNKEGQPPVEQLLPKGQQSPVQTVSQYRLHVRADEGKLPALMAAAEERFRGRFAEADVNRDGFVDDTDKQNLADLKKLSAIADRDNDGRLSEKEFTAWVRLQGDTARGHVLLSVLDHGPGLFELLDGDGDGALSVRELRGAWDRLKATNCVTDGRFDRMKLPHQFFIVVGRGHPQSALGAPVRPPAPEWFRAMDRNRDGDVSRREFTGTAKVFDKLDADKDGLIDATEAAAVEK
jgi:Ca2+-binding EF-hand superfamily protein